MMDFALKEDGGHRAFSLSLNDIVNEVVESSLKKLRELNHDKQTETVLQIARDGKAINWLVGKFFTSQLFAHGRLGDKSDTSDIWEISDELLDEAIDILKERVSEPETHEVIQNFPDISSYLYGWAKITEDDQAKEWVQEYSQSDEGFLNILNHLRGWAMSSKVYYPLSKDTVTQFFDWDDVNARLEGIESGKLADQVAEIQLAIKQSRH